MPWTTPVVREDCFIHVLSWLLWAETLLQLPNTRVAEHSIRTWRRRVNGRVEETQRSVKQSARGALLTAVATREPPLVAPDGIPASGSRLVFALEEAKSGLFLQVR